jgi:hypothetical protein
MYRFFFVGGRGDFGELQDTHVGGGVILKWTLKYERYKGVEWLHLAKGREQGTADVNI